MIFIGVFNVVMLFLCGYLVFRVYKLVKTTDLPQLLSIISIFLSLACKTHYLFISIVILAYIILFIVFVRGEQWIAD